MFQKGHKKIGGRVKGTKNFNTGEIQKMVLAGLTPDYIEDLRLHKPDLYIALAKAMLPKNINLGGQEANELKIKIAGKYGEQ
jgi:hypothetical protein